MRCLGKSQIHRNIPIELTGADVDDLHLDVFLGDARAYFIFLKNKHDLECYLYFCTRIGKQMAERNNIESSENEAVLSNSEGFTAFSFGGYHIRFKAPYSLEHYVDVVKWDDGYLVVLAKYRHNAEPEEEYIDLKPILDGLYIDSADFLKPIKTVRVAYA